MTARRRQPDDIEIDIETFADVRVLQDWRNMVEPRLEKIEKAVNNLPDELVKKLDERYASKKEVEDLKETIDPITKLRKRMWTWFVGLVAGLFLVEYAIQTWAKDLFK